MVKNLPETQETWVWSLGRVDPLENRLATHSNVPVWRIPGQRATVHEVTKSWTNTFTFNLYRNNAKNKTVNIRTSFIDWKISFR